MFAPFVSCWLPMIFHLKPHWIYLFRHLIWYYRSWWCIPTHFMWSRVVESVGEDVTEVAKGDMVVPIFIAECGECIDCKSSKSNLCSKFPFKLSPWMPRHATSRFVDLKGEIIHHFLSVSSFSEYTVVDIAHLIKIDPAIPPNRACLISCGISAGNLPKPWKH